MKLAVTGLGTCILVTVILISSLIALRGNRMEDDDMHFKTLYNLTATAINNTMAIYCSRLSLLFSKNCDQFTTKFLTIMGSPLPQLDLQQQSNSDEQGTNFEILVNISRTLEEFTVLIEQAMNIEHKIICHPVMEVGMKCDILKICTKHKNESDAIFYCGLYSTYSYLLKFKLYFEKKIHDIPKPSPMIEDILQFLTIAPSTSRRWLTVVVLREAIQQLEKIWIHNIPEYSRI